MDTLACAVALSLGLTGQTHALPERAALKSVMQDDALLLHRPPGQVREAARVMHGLGVDEGRITAGWSELAPRPGTRQRPHFDATTSLSYRRSALRRLDT